jgi:hypothetical protein
MADLDDESHHFSSDFDNSFMVCGLPAPGLFYHNFKKMDREVCSKNDMDELFKCTVLQKVDGKVSCENILHYCAKKNDFLKVQAYLESKMPNYMVCPVSPLRLARPHSAEAMLPYFQKVKESGNWKLFSMMELADLKIIINLPGRFVQEYFKTFVIDGKGLFPSVHLGKL